MATLTEFPQEILDIIFTSPDLSRDDRANLNLVNRFFNRTISPHIFRRVRISCLKTDRDSFLAIANSPHLAPLVKELVWDEVPIGYRTSKPLSVLPAPDSAVDEEDDTSVGEILSLIERTAQEVSWLPWIADTPSSPAEPEELENFDRIVKEFLPMFFNAVDKLPNLRCIGSTAMSPDRVLSGGSYPLTLASFFAFCDPNRRRDGFFKFILPILERGGTSIETLRLIDRDVGQTIAMIADTRPAAMTCLRSLDLCLSQTHEHSRVSKKLLVEFARWIHALEALEELRLCFEGEWDNHHHPVADAIARYLLETSIEPPLEGWKNLHTLAVHAAFSASWIVPFLTAHANTIRNVSLCGMEVTCRTIEEMSKINGLRLRHLVIRQDNINDEDDLCDRGQLLKYINKESTEVPWDDSPYGRPHDAIATDIWVNNIDVQSDTESLSSSDSQDVRRAESPYWRWDRVWRPEVGHFGIYYWPVPEAVYGSFPTETWKFTHRDGTIRYGEEPYDWFEDWDTSKGDLAEAVPYGYVFIEELLDLVRPSKITVFWHGPPEVPKLPEGAVLYDMDEDPMVQGNYLGPSDMDLLWKASAGRR